MANHLRYDTGLVLSGGFIKGFAHLGVMQALLERDIRPGIISGASAGALLGVFLSDGNEPYEVLEHFEGARFKDFTDMVFPRQGFMDLGELVDFLRQRIRARNLEDLTTPLVVTATDFEAGRSEHFFEGEIAPRVAASCCMPILFRPITIEGVRYVDGGVKMNLPVSPIRFLCDHIIAVNLGSTVYAADTTSLIGIAERCYDLMFGAATEKELALADFIIEPKGLEKYPNTRLDKAQEIFLKGYEAARELLEETTTKLHQL